MASNHLLRAAAQSGDLVKIEARIAAGDDLEGRHKGTGRTPLLEAVIAGHGEAVALLLDCGADISAACIAVGDTALGWAASQGHFDAARVLLEHGAEVDGLASNSFLQRTPLHLAAQSGDTRIITLLLGAGASLDAVDSRHDNALSLAREGGHDEAVTLLVAAGAMEPVRPSVPPPLPWPDLGWDPCALDEGAALPDDALPAQVVASYIRALYAWEVRAWQESVAARQKAEQFAFGPMLDEAERLTGIHVTDRPRRYRRASVGAIPDLTPDFVLAEEIAPVASRRELHVLHPAPQEFTHEYEWVFICLRRKGRWRIDSARYRLQGTKAWEGAVL